LLRIVLKKSRRFAETTAARTARTAHKNTPLCFCNNPLNKEMAVEVLSEEADVVFHDRTATKCPNIVPRQLVELDPWRVVKHSHEHVVLTRADTKLHRA
jgi:hypothetical protein